MNKLLKAGRMKHIVYMRSILPLFLILENHVIYNIKYVIHFNSSKIMDIMNYRYKQSIRGDDKYDKSNRSRYGWYIFGFKKTI